MSGELLLVVYVHTCGDQLTHTRLYCCREWIGMTNRLRTMPAEQDELTQWAFGQRVHVTGLLPSQVRCCSAGGSVVGAPGCLTAWCVRGVWHRFACSISLAIAGKCGKE